MYTLEEGLLRVLEGERYINSLIRKYYILIKVIVPLIS
jgi:cytoskeletal protein RodZ